MQKERQQIQSNHIVLVDMRCKRRIASDFIGGKQFARIARVVVVCLDRLRCHGLAKTPRPTYAYIPTIGVDPLVEISDNSRLIDVCFGFYNLLKAHISRIQKNAHLALLGHRVGLRHPPDSSGRHYNALLKHWRGWQSFVPPLPNRSHHIAFSPRHSCAPLPQLDAKCTRKCRRLAVQND